MTPAMITAIVSVVTALAAAAGAWTAYVRSNRMAESQVISVTAKAAGEVVQLVTTQLDRSMEEFGRLTKRLDLVDEALDKEKGENASLRLQLERVRHRVNKLESFIKDKGWAPPVVDGVEV